MNHKKQNTGNFIYIFVLSFIQNDFFLKDRKKVSQGLRDFKRYFLR